MSQPTHLGDRRPHLHQLVPSSFQTWEGIYRDRAPLSGDQQATVKARGLDWKTIETIACRRTVGGETFEFECPVLRRDRGKVLVVTPRGYTAWISNDGKITGRERTL